VIERYDMNNHGMNGAAAATILIELLQGGEKKTRKNRVI
jgi:hypothetical protein